MAMWTRRAEIKALRSWRQVTAERRRHRVLLRRAAVKIVMRSQQQAVEVWQCWFGQESAKMPWGLVGSVVTAT